MSGAVSLRLVEPGEKMDDVAALEAALFDDAWDAAALADLVGGYGRRLLVAAAPLPERSGAEADEAGTEVRGYVLTQELGDFVDLLRIGVTPVARRGGLATDLLTAACDHAVGQGAERMLLEVSEANEGARAFYARHGFVEIDRRPTYYRDGSDALILERLLAVGTQGEETP